MARLATRRILIVEDSAAVREALESLLEPYGFEVEHAEDGASGLRRFEAARHDLVLLDLHMPVLDGTAMLRLLRARGHATPVVLVTAASDMRQLQAAIKLGSTDYVCKPFDPGQVRAALARALRMDPVHLVPETPRVLVVDGDRSSRTLLAGALPHHVAVDEADGPQAAEVMAAQAAYRLVLVEGAGTRREAAERTGSALRALEPEAAILLMDAPEAVADGDRRRPTGPFDGVVACPPIGRVATEFLYPVCLRNLVTREREAVTVAAFRGDEADQSVYTALVARRLLPAVRAALKVSGLLHLDLSRLPMRPRTVAAFIDAAMAEAEPLGVEPEFVVDQAVHAALAAEGRSWPAQLVSPGEGG